MRRKISFDSHEKVKMNSMTAFRLLEIRRRGKYYLESSGCFMTFNLGENQRICRIVINNVSDYLRTIYVDG